MRTADTVTPLIFDGECVIIFRQTRGFFIVKSIGRRVARPRGNDTHVLTSDYPGCFCRVVVCSELDGDAMTLARAKSSCLTAALITGAGTRFGLARTTTANLVAVAKDAVVAGYSIVVRDLASSTRDVASASCAGVGLIVAVGIGIADGDMQEFVGRA